MKSNFTKSIIGLSLAAALVVASGQSAFAHVVVKPAEVLTAQFQTFTVSVPNEKDNPTTKLKLIVPEGLEYVTPTVKNGWKIKSEKSKDTVKSITWSDGSIGVDLRDEFTFSAKLPSEATELKWKAYQTYSDGSTVSWDKETDNGHDGSDTGPFSVTKVVAETDGKAIATEPSEVKSESVATPALYTAIAGVVISLVAVFIALRRK